MLVSNFMSLSLLICVDSFILYAVWEFLNRMIAREMKSIITLQATKTPFLKEKRTSSLLGKYIKIVNSEAMD